MAFLVGDNATRTGEPFFDPVDELHYKQGGYAAAETGTATKAYVNIHDVWTATAMKICVYSSAGAILGTAAFASLATGWISANLDSSISITSGQTYYLGLVADNYIVPYGYSGGSWALSIDTTGSYAAPPSTIAVPGGGSRNMEWPSIYLDGTVDGGGLTIPQIMRYYQRLRTS